MKNKSWLIACLLAFVFMAPTMQIEAKKNKKKAQTTKQFELNSKMLKTLKFRSIGPAAYSGRISDIAVNPDNTSEYYVGVASGGLWKTVNHGTTFKSIFDGQDVFSIGCLAMDPNNSNIVWVGTGENNTQRNLAYGDGVYKTTDGGKSFTNMGLKTSSQIGKIMIDPRNSNVVYVAAQGQAWGPGGERGLVGALFGTLGVLIFSLFIISEISEVTVSESRLAFKQVILVSSGIVFFIGLLVWIFMKLDSDIEKQIILEKITISQIREVLRLPSVFLLMIIILCAYVGYKITDVFSLYAKDVMLYDHIQSAQVGTFLLFVRPIIGVMIGILADRSQITFWLVISFIISFLGALLFALGLISDSASALFFMSILVVAIGVYAARSLYFAVMESGQIPLALTGTAVGLISLVGYTPDIFAGPTMGYLLENSPGKIGHQHVFWMLALFSFIGCIAAWYYFRLYRKEIKK